MGDLDVCIIAGFPGTIASTWQQAGRVGRKSSDSLVIFIAVENPLDQYFPRNTAALFSRPSEHALVDPSKPYLLMGHALNNLGTRYLMSKNQNQASKKDFVQRPECQMKDPESILLEKLITISRIDPPESNGALISFLRTTSEIVGLHSIRVSAYAVMSGREMGLPEKMMAELRTSALLHDIGKLLIPPGILFKSASLTESEIEIIRCHPAKGKNILQEINRYRRYSDILYYHHEFYNGRGYPRGLSGDDIPLLSRIISVADSYEAMTTDRPYRKGLSHREAVNRLKMGKSTQFDPEIIESFLRAIKSFSINNICNIETKVDL
ncbi:MAG: HD domain-containing phosphohydrolase [Bacillota bacterium]